jgi:hypothetical protein
MAKQADESKRVKISSYRLEDEVLADLDAIVEFHSAEVGTKLGRTDGIRIAIRNERRRCEIKPKRKS